MRHDFLDRYSRLDSPIHRLPTGLKSVISVVMICLSVALPIRVYWIFAAILAMLVLVSALSKIPLRFVIGRLLLLEPFALGVAILALFQRDGISVFLTILIKSTLCLLTIIILSNTTPFSRLLDLFRRIGVPSLLITVLALAYRYLFVIIDEAERLQRARSSRTFVGSRAFSWVALGSLVGQLFVRSTERAERIFAAMSSRGWI
jgi:cobalt/nickel transport system permease protein